MNLADKLFPIFSPQTAQTAQLIDRSVRMESVYNFSAKFGSLHMQVRNNFENIICIAVKFCKISKYFVNSIIILCNTYQKEHKECILVKYLIYAILPGFQFCRNLRTFFPSNSISAFF